MQLFRSIGIFMNVVGLLERSKAKKQKAGAEIKLVADLLP